METDVLVIGAGPAGSAAARVLAQAGLRVLLVDRHAFPRDKACGDALIPDAQAALAELGLKARVDAAAYAARQVRIYTPNNSFITLDGGCSCVPRTILDDLLRTAAVEAGAGFRGRWRAVRALETDGLVRGAVVEDLDSGETHEIRARLTLLATGGASDVLERFGMSLRSTPSATAARIYVRATPARAAEHPHLSIAFAASVSPGYGWVFPGPDDVFNIGVGYFYDAPRRPALTNTRHLLDAFCRTFEPAARLLQDGEIVSSVQGAPLRTAMRGARLSRPGLLVLGEAAGLTYSGSGEGIGKALYSGMAAARLAARHDLASPAGQARLATEYAETLRAEVGPRFAAYARVQRWLAYPAVTNFIAWRANHGTYVRAQMQALFDETSDPRGLFSWNTVLRVVFT